MRRPGDRHDGDAEADRPCDPIAGAARLHHDPIELAASLGPEERRAEEDEKRQRDIESVRSGAVQAKAPIERGPLSPLGSEQHLGRGRVNRDLAQRPPRRPSPSEHLAQPSHDPSSTIPAPGLLNEKPAWPARSGRGDVAVGTRPGVDSETDAFAFARRPAEVKVGAAYAATTRSQ